ncbi:MAG: NADPH:quinone oxidoreductase family protein [Pseudomonadota bacterium]
MRALRVTEFKKSPRVMEIETPAPAPGEVLIKVAACGLNFADLLMIKGEYQATPTPPFTLGLELAGEVVALGADVTALKIGQRVAVFGGGGGLAEFALARPEACIPLPDTISLVEAAGFQIAYGTSHLALTDRARLKPGDTLLVLGAAGGVGLTAVEIGAGLGAEVTAVARGAEKLAVARAAGAHHLIDAGVEDIAAAIKRAGPFAAVYDPVGGALGEAGLRALARGGHFLVIGFASGDLPALRPNHLLVKNVSVHGFYWGGYLEFDPESLRASLQALLALHAAGKISPHIGLTADLDAASDALEKLRKRQTTGKVVITLGAGHR